MSDADEKTREYASKTLAMRRRKVGITQKALSEVSGVSRSSIAAIEAKTYSVYLYQWIALKNAFKRVDKYRAETKSHRMIRSAKEIE